MPEKTEALKATSTVPVYVRLLLAALAAFNVLMAPMLLAVYLRYLDASSCAAERQAVIDRIEQFHEQHGRYPTYREAQEIVSGPPFRVRHYEVTAAGFQIELVRDTLLPPGERSWTYDSETKSWDYFSESY